MRRLAHHHDLRNIRLYYNRMSKNSPIEWCHHTFNIAWGCVRSSRGCDHCYAENLSARWGYDVWGPGKPRRTFGPKHWAEPIKWNTDTAARGVRERVFCSSMTDVFLNDPTIDREREKLWPLIRSTPHLDWLILTKHPERIGPNLPDAFPKEYPNVWLGVSAEDTAAAWRVRTLAALPAAVRFISAEPLLGSLRGLDLTGIDWVIVGGESGAKARPMELAWARELRDNCLAATPAIRFFLKQLGGHPNKHGHDLAVLDGRRWVEFPESTFDIVERTGRLGVRIRGMPA